ncbi:16S rRNA (adenine(1518)-N(6)/adenine(1519)-N(6))-dimethyltransferase RsmA [Geitlerinema sp. PCC 9228]|uniref:16S rRNA (adenine(1518)-N(6)/adenine(1519)-N(6))- dimethyltransferase RsmA n=1 Tax=Geitlerinema sp. PCC 9228 TaxID=111611 RepID=UPI0008F9C9FF|nr:16S rRNA (adenine(1518)-N(6)/adenine(1519)-N(6))-dimethyltransferase RsmA [Geitlerinema sp. PCC 9228]
MSDRSLKHQPRKRFAQHWLRDGTILDEIVAAAQLSPADFVLEIGPGTGWLTRRLLEAAGSVVAVEIDWDLYADLQKKLGDREHLILLSSDILSLDWQQLQHTYGWEQQPNKVVANIPYNITGPILEKLLGTIAQPVTPAFDTLVLLVQKEVAERLQASPGSKTFGALSVRVQYLADCQWVTSVPARYFTPPPKVDSAVVRLHPRRWQVSAENPRLLETLVKLGFANKRKMLRNNLKSCLSRDRLSQFLQQLQANPQCRAEDLGVEEWVALSNWVAAASDRRDEG